MERWQVIKARKGPWFGGFPVSRPYERELEINGMDESHWR
jgi:hypothetical protein